MTMTLEGTLSDPQQLEADATEETAQFLTFIVGEQEYGVDILRVQEIKGWDAVTRIPNTPDYLKGVLNLRGAIVPIVDLRMRFQMDQCDYDGTTVIVVVRVVSKDGERIMGVVVDAVADVVNLGDQDRQPAPDLGVGEQANFITGFATTDERMIVLLDIDELMSGGELSGLDDLAVGN